MKEGDGYVNTVKMIVVLFISSRVHIYNNNRLVKPMSNDKHKWN